jgi:hypothetical protein
MVSGYPIKSRVPSCRADTRREAMLAVPEAAHAGLVEELIVSPGHNQIPTEPPRSFGIPHEEKR